MSDGSMGFLTRPLKLTSHCLCVCRIACVSSTRGCRKWSSFRRWVCSKYICTWQCQKMYLCIKNDVFLQMLFDQTQRAITQQLTNLLSQYVTSHTHMRSHTFTALKHRFVLWQVYAADSRHSPWVCSDRRWSRCCCCEKRSGRSTQTCWRRKSDSPAARHAQMLPALRPGLLPAGTSNYMIHFIALGFSLKSTWVLLYYHWETIIIVCINI